MRGLLNAFATAISLGLQYGVPLEDFVRKFSYMRFDPEGMTQNPEIPFAKSMPDYIMRWLASRFIDDIDTLEELGIMTQEVRGKKEAETSQLGLGISTDTAGPANGGGNGLGRAKTGNGNGGVKASNGGAAKPASAAFTETPPVRPARMQGMELGPACDQCGGMMQRTGSCYTCSSCGNNTGCG
jgi:ribonucleoside-diphosphate reductase alpha chain